jgi:radical SAM superfamily enzyme YgiQ (UPF0313 family)
MSNLYVNQINPSGERNLLPLAAGLLTASVRNDPYLNDAFDVKIMCFREDVSSILDKYEDPEVMGFSLYTWNFNISMLIAERVKKRYPDVKLIMGGPSTPRNPEDIQQFFAQHPFVDFVVHGEGEVTFVELLTAIKQENSYEEVLGISYRDQSLITQVRTTPSRPRIKSLSEIPSPFLTGVFDELLETDRHRITGTVWESNRGCPFKCTFCDWGQATQSKVMVHDSDRLIQELNWISDRKIPYIFSADANFGIKRTDIHIAEHIGDLYQAYGYPHYMMVNWTKNSHEKTINIADTLKRSGVGFMVTLSMQSFHDQTLEAIKRSNISLDTFEILKKEYNQRNIDTYSELLLGLPGETYESFTDGLIKVLSPLPTDHFALYLCVVLPNAEMAHPEYRKLHGLETRMTRAAPLRQQVLNREIFETDETIVATKTMPLEDWRKAYCFGYLLRALHNMKLAFDVIEFLKAEYNISPKDFVEFVIEAVRSSKDYSVIGDMLAELDRAIDSILAEEDSTLTVEQFPGYHWEPHELCFLKVFKHVDEFYDELDTLASNFAQQLTLDINKKLVAEVCNLQREISPLNKRKDITEVVFETDVLSKCPSVQSLDVDKAHRTRPYVLAFYPSESVNEDTNELEKVLSAVRACASSSLDTCRIEYVEQRATA